ncbi:hypothetical protein SAMN05443572_1011159 [Myxococcus fulvus]|uniref:Pilus biogenesis protein n=1 Tax=Myxococcus fulvus TaxID=33 RepID=A0A511SUU8_MYXFU|nr:hypothetical protein [Myxococcus fulvus]AKF79853.1 hypothetical protein MFUL124B02_06725 [Myxococcus fulvus 124B02]GEN05297.1 hypothetical protein MFU01_03340 [Myxococcus fulvus]SET12049.1 hypothetical protein SAMN05443572_1011159 [Myxococcus fulvus]
MSARTGSRLARGSAAVETALCMLVIIPVFMYAIFLDDLLKHVLDAQETVVSTVWDYAVSDYAAKPEGGESFANFGQTQGLARQMFCDHESGLDSYGPGKGPECDNDVRHHQDVVAHACWLYPEAKQVYCTVDQNAVGSYGVTLHAAYMRQFNKGGLIRCSARSSVQNYLLPTTFLQEFSQVDLAKEQKQNKGQVHSNSQGGTEKDTYLLSWEYIALVTDTWALTKGQSFSPGEGQKEEGDLYARVQQIYSNQENSGYTQMSSASEELVKQAIDRNLLASSLELNHTPGDDPRDVSLSIQPQNGGAPSQIVIQGLTPATYFNNEWRDWEVNNNQATARERGNYYMGCRQPGKC